MNVTRMVITIAREEGSGGREIAQELANELRLSYIDNHLIKLATRHLGIPEEELAEFDEKVLPRVDELCELVTQPHEMPLSPILVPDRDVYGLIQEKRQPILSSPAEVFKQRAMQQGYQNLVERLIKEVAQHGRAVIVGRGANFILKDWPGVVNVYVSAPLSSRIERIAYLRHIDQAEAARLINETDEQRASYIRQNYAMDWRNPDHYNLMINTANLPLATATAAIAEFVRELERNRKQLDPLALHKSYDRLTAQESYSLKEASELLLLSPDVIRHAIYQGELKGTLVNHRVARISREALANWLRHSQEIPVRN